MTEALVMHRRKSGRRAYAHNDGDPAFDRRPTHAETTAILQVGNVASKRDLLLRVCGRVYESGLREGRGYVATPDLTLRRLVAGLQHAISHVHHHCKHSNDWIDSLAHDQVAEEDEDELDDLPHGRSAPIARGSRLSGNSWRRCTKAPCKSVVTIVTECRLWDLIDSQVAHSHRL